MSSPTSTASRVLVLNSDRLLAHAIHCAAEALWPAAWVSSVSCLRAASAALRATPVDLLITGLAFVDGDVCELVRRSATHPRRALRIAVMTRRHDPRTLILLRALPVDGAFDTGTESLSNFGPAFQEIMSGKKYFSSSFLSLFWSTGASRLAELQALTATEQLVLAVIGDGCDDREAAARLGLSVANIHSIRRGLHAKLGLQDRGELIQRAVEYGLVGISGRGIERLGLTLLIEQYEASRRGQSVHTDFLDTMTASLDMKAGARESRLSNQDESP